MVRRSELMMKIRNMTAAVADAMAAVSLYVQRGNDEEPPIGGCRFEARMLRESLTPLRNMLYEVLDCIREDWNLIIQNDMLFEELRRLLEACDRFHENAYAFDEAALGHGPLLDDLLGDAWLPRIYLVNMIEWEKEAEYVRSYVRKNCPVGVRLDDPFRGVAARLHKFFHGVSDNDIREFVMNGVSLAGKPKWIGDKCQAVIFGQMLGKTCKEMNDSFLFCRKSGEPLKLAYSHHKPDLEMNQYDIHGIIEPLRDATNKKKD